MAGNSVDLLVIGIKAHRPAGLTDQFFRFLTIRDLTAFNKPAGNEIGTALIA
jgi:hypothetical protein